MRTYLTLTRIQLKLFSREPVALFFTLLFPLLLLVMYGAMFGNDPEPLYHGFGYIDFEVPGLTGVIIGTVALMSIPVATATAREKQILRRLKATPMRPWHYLAADITSNYLVALIGMIVLTIAAKLIFDVRIGGNLFQIFLGFSLSLLAFASFGYTVASLSPTSRIAQVVGQVIFFPMMFLSGATLPLQIMPEGMRTISDWLPLTQVVNLLQSLWFGQGWDTTAVLVLVAMLVVGAIVATRTFRWE